MTDQSMTEGEAKARQCLKPAGSAPNAEGTCIGSGCMAWRWKDAFPLPDDPPSISERYHGFCGLAGRAMSTTEMVHIVDMTVEDFRVAADWHRLRGETTTADSMMLLPPVLAHLTEDQRACLRRLPVNELQIELSKLVRFKNEVVDATVEVVAQEGFLLDHELITGALMDEYAESPVAGPQIMRGAAARESIGGLVRDAIRRVETRRLGT